MRFPSDAALGEVLLLRIVINGADSPPRWIEVS
jgi:hypothetical protein